MAFDKNYPNRKDHRRPYRKSKQVDRSCRCHGSCSYCQSNRQHNNEMRLAAAADAAKEDNE
jgi:hypothetical protein